MSLDTGDFVGCPVGGGNSDSIRASSAQGSLSASPGLDGQLSGMEGSSAGDPTAHELQTTHLRRGLMSGLRMGVFIFTYTLQLTLTVKLPRVMCLCIA